MVKRYFNSWNISCP